MRTTSDAVLATMRRLGPEPKFGLLVLGAGVGAGLFVVRGGPLAALAAALAVSLPLLSGFRVPRLLAVAGWAMLLPTVLTIGVSLQPALIVAYLGAAAWVALRSERHRSDPWMVWSALAFVGLLALSAWRALRLGDAPLSPWVGFGTIAAQVLFVLAGSARVSKDGELEEFVRLLASPSLFLAGWSISESLLARGLVFPLVDVRPVGPFGNPNYFGALLAILTVMQLSLAVVDRAGGRRALLPFATAVACLVGTLATLSRGAILGMAAGGALLALRAWHRRRMVLVVILLATVVGVIGPVLYGALAEQRASESSVTRVLGTQAAYQADAYATQVRQEAARLAWGYALDHPWTGIGLDRFAVEAERDPTFLIQINTHNEPLRLAAEAGLLATGLFLAFIGIVVVRIRRRGSTVATLALPAMACYGAISLFLNGLEYLTLTYPIAAIAFLAVGRPATMTTRTADRAVPAA